MYVTTINGEETEHYTIQAAADQIALATKRYPRRVADMFQLRAFAEACGLDRIEAVHVRN
jgi:hypothetical protein